MPNQLILKKGEGQPTKFCYAFLDTLTSIFKIIATIGVIALLCMFLQGSEITDAP